MTDVESNLQRQKEECETLESICGPSEFTYDLNGTEPVGCVVIDVIVPSDFIISYSDPKTNNNCDFSVSYLPPLHLHFRMPPEYPDTRPPTLTLSSQWLWRTHGSRLCAKLDLLWKENAGCEILFSWIQFLKDETLKFLNMSKLDISTRNEILSTDKTCTHSRRIEQHYLDDRSVLEPSKELPFLYIKEHNKQCLQREFEHSSVLCEICFETKAGSHCVQFNCSHAFCKTCVTEYLLTKIKDGTVKSILCPGNKCDSEATVPMVKELLNSDMFASYEQMLLQQTLDTMGDIIYCPRTSCQYPVMYDTDELVASCPACRYPFCILCKGVYHGVEPCKWKQKDRLDIIEKYKHGTDDDKQRLEKRYGVKHLERLIEEHESEETIAKCSQRCPNCKINIEKSQGCNKMLCNRCQTTFCWLCSCKIHSADPYEHFTNPASKCFNRLFPVDYVEAEDERDRLFFIL